MSARPRAPAVGDVAATLTSRPWTCRPSCPLYQSDRPAIAARRPYNLGLANLIDDEDSGTRRALTKRRNRAYARRDPSSMPDRVSRAVTGFAAPMGSTARIRQRPGRARRLLEPLTARRASPAAIRPRLLRPLVEDRAVRPRTLGDGVARSPYGPAERRAHQSIERLAPLAPPKRAVAARGRGEARPPAQRPAVAECSTGWAGFTVPGTTGRPSPLRRSL